MKMVKIVILSILTLFFAGCASITQEANTGKSLKITVIVKDGRSSKSLGIRRSGYGSNAYIKKEVTSTQNIEELVMREILKGLKKKGFDTTEYYEKHDRELIAELRLLEYVSSTGLMTGKIHVEGALKAIGKNKGMAFEETYRFESKKKIIIVPTTRKNERLITAGMSHLSEVLFSDERLFKFLSN